LLYLVRTKKTSIITGWTY